MPDSLFLINNLPERLDTEHDMLLGKTPGNDFEVYNDFDRDLTNLFRCIRERPLQLIRELGFLTLNSRDDFNVLKKFINQEEFTDQDLCQEM